MTAAGAAFDLDALLKPVPGSQRAGADLRYEPAYDRIKVTRRAADDKTQGKASHGEGTDALSPEKRVLAARETWLTVRTLILDALQTKSKDLQLAVWLLESDTYLGGFPGTSQGLILVRRLIEEYWDDLYPPIDAEDEEPLALRAAPMTFIDSKLPEILLQLPLTAGAEPYSLAHYKLAANAKTPEDRADLVAAGRPSTEQFVHAMSASPPAHLESLDRVLTSCLTELRQLEDVTNVRFVEAPRNGGSGQGETLLSFSTVRALLEECQAHVNRARKRKTPPPPPPPDTVPRRGPDDLPDGPGAGDGGIWSQARALVTQGKLEGLHLAQHHIQAAASGRERFLRQLELSELCVQARMYVFAYPIFDDLAKIVEDRRLVEWEDTEVIRRIWSGLAGVCKPLAQLRPESVERGKEAEDRLRALNETKAPPES